MDTLRQTRWGYEIVRKGKVVALGVGLDPVKFRGLSVMKARHLRKYGKCPA